MRQTLRFPAGIVSAKAGRTPPLRIVSREVFEYVQQLMKRDTRTAPEQSTVYLLSGFVKCGDCGENMIRKPGKAHGKQYCYYRCSEFVHQHNCSSHNISEEKLCTAITKAIQSKVGKLLQVEEVLKNADQLPEKRHAVTVIDTQINVLLDEVARYRNLRTHLYQDRVEGVLSSEEYSDMDQRFSEKLKTAEDGIEVLQQNRDRNDANKNAQVQKDG